MRKLANLVWIIFVMSLFPLCACRPASTREAEKVARQYFDAFLLECGDSHYTIRKVIPFGEGIGMEVSEIKDHALRVQPIGLTKAEKANGVEWKGNIVTTCSIFRWFDGYSWSAWVDCPTWTHEINKIHGEWSSKEWPDFPDARPSEFTCEDIPE